MPDYSIEEKAAAFDLLWETCGKGRPEFYKWRDYVPPPPSSPKKMLAELAITRVPVYHFTIAFDGECDSFADVLHHLATKRKGYDQQPQTLRPTLRRSYPKRQQNRAMPAP